jgi:hypothetical protein
MKEPLSAIKARYSIAQAWFDLGLAGAPTKICRSPFRNEHRNGDAHPSFSVYAEGTRWKDQATGEGGDVFDLVRKARGVEMAGAITWVRERMGAASPQRFARAAPSEKPRAVWPELRQGTPEELAELAQLRSLNVEAVQLAAARGFLHFGTLWHQPFWALTDSRRSLAEFRRLDGKPWPAFGRLAERKSHCLGSGKDWPVGIVEAAQRDSVAWMEGTPDFLAFLHFALAEGRAEHVAPVAMLGAANQRIAADALALLRGKSVVLYPHCDAAGQTAAKAWARQLRAAGARVSAFDLSGAILDDGTTGKDLNDLCRLSAECFDGPEGARLREVCP